MSFVLCNVCIKKISLEHHNALQCNNCKFWTHKKCNKLNDIDFNLQKSNSFWFCIVCVNDLFPFSGVADNELKLINSIDNCSNIDELSFNINLFPSNNNNKLFKRFNDFFTSQSLCNSEDDEFFSNPITIKVVIYTHILRVILNTGN